MVDQDCRFRYLETSARGYVTIHDVLRCICGSRNVSVARQRFIKLFTWG